MRSDYEVEEALEKAQATADALPEQLEFNQAVEFSAIMGSIEILKWILDGDYDPYW